ncbi:MAG: DUF5063 domain-containing protein [Tannerellaceae bacterium]|jgi:hypothetical protein|nr:DUF5063 domain-containing protein [Tannerellaceae bacterium]
MNEKSNNISTTDNTIYNPQTIDFVKTALAYCSLMEAGEEAGAGPFINKATKLLPMLYLKALMLPELYSDNDFDEPGAWLCVTESMYEAVRTRIAALLGENDAYLETFHPDMPLSDAPIAAFISEDLADVYQDACALCLLFREGSSEAMLRAVAICKANFELYWGQKLLNALKALHALRYPANDMEMLHNNIEDDE